MALPARLVTAEEFLALERASPVKHELVEGEIFGMAGTSAAHNRIFLNLAETLGPLARQSGCQTFGSDLRLHVPETGLFTYPDLMVVCGTPEYLDGEFDTLTNPVVVIEILSPGTEAYDRGAKFAHYRTMKSLKEYILVSQNQRRVEVFLRLPDDKWILEVFEGEGTAKLTVSGMSVSLEDCYRNVEFAQGGGQG